MRELAINTLHEIAIDPNYDPKGSTDYRKSWITMYEDYKHNNIDRLFFNAPEIIVIVSEDKAGFAEVNGGIAASRMELQANTLGLGVCYIGFLKRAYKFNNKIGELIGMKDNEDLILSYVLGYPNVEYQRTVNRKPSDVRII